ncbi:DNA helicase INO80, partial [Geosmithia morbida]
LQFCPRLLLLLRPRYRANNNSSSSNNTIIIITIIITLVVALASSRRRRRRLCILYPLTTILPCALHPALRRDPTHINATIITTSSTPSRSFYDPTTDSTTTPADRRGGEESSWQTATTAPNQPARDPYAYNQSADNHHHHHQQQQTYYNGAGARTGDYTSPRAYGSNQPPAAAPRSPLSHPHQHSLPPTSSVGSVSPISRHPQRASSPGTSRSADPMSFSNILSSAEPAPKPRERTPVPELRAPEPDGEARFKVKVEAEPEPEPGPEPEPELQQMADKEMLDRDDETEPEPSAPSRASSVPKKKAAPRKSTKGRASDIREQATSKSARRSSIKRESPTPRPSAKRQANGQAKNDKADKADRSWSSDMEKKIQKSEIIIDKDTANLDADEFDERDFKERAAKRRRLMIDFDRDQNRLRRQDYTAAAGKKLALQAELGKRRYDDVFYDDALNEVREQELHAEKERKKDMQRKRRREKSMAVTLEQKEAALARADAAEDEAERQKHLRDAERANKKAQQTKHILQKGIKGPARHVEINLEGGTMSTFLASDMENGGSATGNAAGTPTSKSKSKSKAGSRPKKSKEQKQAEKESAMAAQAAIDAGQELPAKDEGKVRLKITNKAKKSKDKTKGKDKDKDKDKEDVKDKDGADIDIDVDVDADADPADADADKENGTSGGTGGGGGGGKKKKKELKESKESKEKVDDVPDLEKKFISKGYNQIYDQILRDVARKDVNKTFKLASDSCATKSSNLKKTAVLASKEAKRWQLRTNKGTKDLQARAKRVMRDMMTFWKRNEREERDLRKAAEKQEIENARKEEADREAARQKRKLNFLISQTELYSHFIGKKIKTDEVERSTDNPEIAPTADTNHSERIDVPEPTGLLGSKVTDFENLTFEEGDEDKLQAAAMANAQNAIAEAQQKARDFNNQGLDMDEEGEMNFQNPTGLGDVEIEQPKLINCQLKEYQLKGLNWLVNLYEQGINGILADEMGLGKTVQSISVMAYLAEKHDIWGPFLVVAPASTLHNWQQEIAKFVPEFKILPYWGGAGDRKILRKFWDRKHGTYRKDAAFHVCVTSYQLVVSDVAYFQKMKWQYMILDEAQAIKSSSSSRWKSLLGFHCRNRLLLTGTPIQNNMQELWALLHFIMPSLFDSHDEFSEWFSKDIESHAQSNTKLNEDQLKRLHMILKPFMLRRVKKHVQKELGDKIEEDIFCDLTYRQRAYYGNLRNQINILDLVEKATMGDDQDSGTLMNLVMQFRKVCNHPDLFERASVTSPFSFGYFAETASFVREGSNVAVSYSSRNLIEYSLPSMLGSGSGGRLDRPGYDNVRAGWRSKALDHMMNVFSPEHVRESCEEEQGGFSWLRFADVSPGDVYKATHSSIFTRAADELQKPDRLAHMGIVYDDSDGNETGFTPAHALFSIRDRQRLRARAEVTRQGILSSLINVAADTYSDSGLGRLEPAGRPRASAPPIEVSCAGRASVIERENVLFNVPMRKSLYGPTQLEEVSLVRNRIPLSQYPPVKMLPKPDHERKRFTNIAVPSMQRFVTDSGKLAKLDELLFRLKAGGHRVLLYFQMTKMIDMMEEYLTYRNFKYCRLDGSTKLEDRRDTVHDFQTRPEIFIFLLSTRAGGLGINLTSADTVIFYDSDWNPTIDSQAMDRAHRLGQTRQVTVYRLITKGTIEERIRKRALQKEEVQRVVIQGGGASVDFSGRRAPENRNRDIAMWLADDEQAEMIEKREKELLESGELDKQTKRKGGARKKKAEASSSLEDLYHEGEGHFDDGSKISQSGAATPADSEKGRKPGSGGAPSGAAGRKSTAKRAKTAKQRLALADGTME